MAVFRVEKTKDFTVMSNHHLRNVSLSLKAKGLLSLMLSLPDNWDYTTKGLAHICKDGVDSISSAIKELEKQGYLTRQRLRDAHGRLGDIEYVIHEKPVLPDEQDAILPPKRENPRQVNPRQVKPVLGKPEQEKPAQLNIQESITEKSITDISNIHQSIYPASGGTPDGNTEMDRDKELCALMKKCVEQENLSAAVAHGGLEGLRLLKENKDTYCLIILDVMMPGMVLHVETVAGPGGWFHRSPDNFQPVKHIITEQHVWA